MKTGKTSAITVQKMANEKVKKKLPSCSSDITSKTGPPEKIWHEPKTR